MNILHTNASQVAALDLGYAATLEELKKNEPKILFLLGADEPLIKKEDFGNSFIVYIGIFNKLKHDLFINFIVFNYTVGNHSVYQEED